MHTPQLSKAAAVLFSFSLFAGFVAYRSGYLHWYNGQAKETTTRQAHASWQSKPTDTLPRPDSARVFLPSSKVAILVKPTSKRDTSARKDRRYLSSSKSMVLTDVPLTVPDSVLRKMKKQ